MRHHTLTLAGLACALLVTPSAWAQAADDVDRALLQKVFPEAERFGLREGTPPVWRAYAGEELAGYVFLTSDVPPEEKGYNGPIDVLVGMDVSGGLTGISVVDYIESLRTTRGDFLSERGFQEQYAGKHLADAFRVRRDVRNLSGATITVAAMSRGIRSSARRVAAAYLTQERGRITAEEIERLSWPELAMRGIGDRLIGVDRGVLRVELHLVPLSDERMGRVLMGDAFDEAVNRAGDRLAERHPWMVGLDGPMGALFRASALTILRGADTIRFTGPDLVLTAEPRSGKVAGEFSDVGLLLVDASVDPADSFVWRLELGGIIEPASVEHPGEWRTLAAAPTPAAGAVAPVPGPAEAADVEAPGAPSAEASVAEADSGTDVAAAESEPAAAVEAEPRALDFAPLDFAELDFAELDFAAEEEETLLQRTLADTSWVRVGVMLGVLALATAAFFAKIPTLRWVALAVTLIVLGWGGGGFLSVSHITAGIKVGPSVYLENLPLLLMVAFTVVTTLLWGRVFCGYLCPFGALQDFMEQVISKRLRQKFPHPVHEGGLFLKYGVLVVILVPVLLGSEVSIFQYFEPFGTVFFLSRSTLLWAIAIVVLVAAAIIPRFYCRYVCPLGAALALASLLSPFRIKRVEHCTVCRVCEHACPTGAIRRESIAFHECVRCNVCEVKLTERAGVCRHDLEKVSRLIQIGMGHARKGHPLEVASGD